MARQQASADPEPMNATYSRPKKRPRTQTSASPPILARPDAQPIDDAVARSLCSTKLEERDPSHKYARRPRHKTKADKYEYKGHEEKESQSRKKVGQTKRSSRRKSGTTLNQDFKAPNVESERLTLKQNPTLGIFSKGKASAPVPRRGLPDLTFSKMTFLNKKRELDDARFRGKYDLAHPRKNRKRAVQDISEYFARPADESSEVGNRSLSDPKPSPPDSSPAKFLGRQVHSSVPGTRNAIRVRSFQSDRDVHSPRKWHTDPAIPELRHYHPTGAVSLDCEMQRSASCVSWLQSPERPAKHTSDPNRLTDAHRKVKNIIQHAATTIHPRSSASRPDHTLRSKHQHYQLDARPARKYYSLEDLKWLAASRFEEEQLGANIEDQGRVQNAHSPHELAHGANREPIYQDYYEQAAHCQTRDQPPTSITYLERMWEEPHPLRQNIAQKADYLGAGHEYQDLRDTHRDVNCLSESMPLQLGTAQGVLDLLDPGINFSKCFRPPLNLPMQRLWQNQPDQHSAVASYSPSYEQLQFEDLHPSNAAGRSSGIRNRSVHLNEHQHLEVDKSEAGETCLQGADALDAFDSTLLKSAKALHGRAHPNATIADKEHFKDYGQGEHFGYDAELASEHYGVENSEPAMNNEGMMDTETRPGTCLRATEDGEGRRSQLFRPSEEAALSSEPFTGFSRPWVLY